MGRSLGFGLAPKREGASCVEVFFAHRQPDDTSDFQRFFRAPVRFNAPGNYVEFPVALLNRQRRDAAPVVSAALERRADQTMRQARRPERLDDRVRGLVSGALQRGVNPTELQIAGLLRTTPRTLRRRLSIEGTSFFALLDSVKRERVLAHLKDADSDVAGAVALGGFSGEAALRRAIKRWTGRSVGELRKDLART
jgi:AraC-like DNA-binding protein